MDEITNYPEISLKEAFHKYKKDTGLTSADVARALNVQKFYLSWLVGDREYAVPVRLRKRIADLIGVRTEYIIKEYGGVPKVVGLKAADEAQEDAHAETEE